jgi:signal peptidase II
MRRASRFLLLTVVLVMTVACDQITKSAARRTLGSGAEYELLGGVLTLTLAENQGAFLSVGSGLPGFLRVAAVSVGVVALLVVAVVVLRDRNSPLPLILAVALMLAGATGNLVDRLCRGGKVTDFLLLGAGPLHSGVFNLADLAIMAGVVAFLLGGIQSSPVSTHRDAGHPPPRW